MINFVQKWKDKIIALIDTQIKLVQLEIIERLSKLLGTFIFVMIFLLLGFAVFLFAGLGLAEKLSELTDSVALGYLGAAICYLIVGSIFFFFRVKIVKSFSNIFVIVLTEKQEDEEEEKELSVKIKVEKK